MNKLMLYLTAAVCFSLLNIATADSITECITRMDYDKYHDYGNEEAFPFCDKACNLNDGGGCVRLGFLYMEGKGVIKDYRLAKKYYEEACDLQNGEGCVRIGDLYRDGRGVKQDDQKAKMYYEKAKTYFEKTCGLKDGEGCVSLGDFYVYADRQKAMTYYECSAKSPQNPFEAKIEPDLPTPNPKRSHFLRF